MRAVERLSRCHPEHYRRAERSPERTPGSTSWPRGPTAPTTREVWGMTLKYQTVVTCDRCDGETRYDSRDKRRWEAEWASAYPATVVPYGARPPLSAAESMIC